MPRVPPPPPVEAQVASEQRYLFAAPAARMSEQWWASAACRQAEPEVFFPLSKHDLMSRRIAESYCAACPVNEQCLTVALRDRGLVGIWGGTDEEERRRMRGRPTEGSPTSLRMINM